MAARGRVYTGIRFLRENVRQGIVDIPEACDRDEFGGMVRCAKGLHAGKGFCAADARAAVDCKLMG